MATVHNTREIRTDIINGPSQGGPGSTAAERGSVDTAGGWDGTAGLWGGPGKELEIDSGASSLAIGLQVFHGERDQAWGREDQGRLTE